MNPGASRFRLRIALLSAAISGLVLVSFAAAAWYWLRHDRIDGIDRELRALAYRHPGWISQRANFERLAAAIEFILGRDSGQRIAVAALSPDGAIHFRSESWPAGLDADRLPLDLQDDSNPGTSGNRPLFTKIPRHLTLTAEGAPWRLAILGSDSGRLVIGLELTAMNRELGRLRNAFLVALPVSLLGIAGGGWLVAAHALRPVRRIASTLEPLGAQGLDRRIQVRGDDPDLDHLVRVLNGMLDRLESSFRQATRFSADASHELKTPLAVLQAELELALQQVTAGSEDEKTYASLLSEVQRLRSITRVLLLLAQADSGRLPLSRSNLDLADLLRTLTEDAAILAEERQCALESDLPAQLSIEADFSLLRLALTNLLENAVHYNRPGGWVRVRLEPSTDLVRVRVTNSGPGIPAGEQPHVFERFQRGASARASRREGSGLGLSLAREIVHAHGGRLHLLHSDVDSTTFELTLPT